MWTNVKQRGVLLIPRRYENSDSHAKCGRIFATKVQMGDRVTVKNKQTVITTPVRASTPQKFGSWRL